MRSNEQVPQGSLTSCDGEVPDRSPGVGGDRCAATVARMSMKGDHEQESIDDVVARLEDWSLRRLLAESARSHEDVMRAVRLAGADEDERLDVLKAAVDDGLRTRRNLNYWGSSAWASDAAIRAWPCAGARSPNVPTPQTRRSAGHRRFAITTTGFRASLRSTPPNGLRSSIMMLTGSSRCSAETCPHRISSPLLPRRW